MNPRRHLVSEFALVHVAFLVRVLSGRACDVSMNTAVWFACLGVSLTSAFQEI